MVWAGNSFTQAQCLIVRIYAASSITNRRSCDGYVCNSSWARASMHRLSCTENSTWRFSPLARWQPLPEEFAVDGVISWFDVLASGVPAPENNSRAVMVDDGSAFWWTYGVAEAMAEAGWRVLLATPAAMIAGAIPHESVGPLLSRLGRAGTEYRVLTTLLEVGTDGAHLMNVTSGDEEIVTCGLVVIQTGRSAVTTLAEKFEHAQMEFHAIGDCVTPRRMSHAVFEAHRLAGTI